MCLKKNVHTLIVLLHVCHTAIGEESGDVGFTNVGSVLFSKSDIWRSHWSKRELNVLKSRMMFENIIPDPEVSNVINEKYLENLLKYCNDIYKSVMVQSHDPESEIVLTTALSDALGGFLHVYILPASKLGYYAGAITYQTFAQIRKFDKELLRFLRTDGSGWSMPYMSKYSAVVPYEKIEIRPSSIEEPCKYIYYYEQTPKGMKIPIPRLKYDPTLSTIFIPLQNESLYSLDDYETSLSLNKYYTIATSCLESNPLELLEFKQRFQGWIDNDVLPHIMDSNNSFYGFGNVLGLVNDTQLINQKLANNPKLNLQLKQLNETPSSCKMCFYKVGIVLAILFVELIWCLVAMVVWCVKRRKRRKSSKDCGGTSNTVAACVESGLFESPTYSYERIKKPQEKEPKSKRKLFSILSSRKGNFEIDTLYKAPIKSKISVATEARTSTISHQCSAFQKSSSTSKRSDSQATSKKLVHTKSKCLQKSNSLASANIQCKPSMSTKNMSEQLQIQENKTTTYDVQYCEKGTSKIFSKVDTKDQSVMLLPVKISNETKQKDSSESISSGTIEKEKSSENTTMRFICDSCLDLQHDEDDNEAVTHNYSHNECQHPSEVRKIETSNIYYSPTATSSIETVFRTLKSSENTATLDEIDEKSSFPDKLKSNTQRIRSNDSQNTPVPQRSPSKNQSYKQASIHDGSSKVNSRQTLKEPVASITSQKDIRNDSISPSVHLLTTDLTQTLIQKNNIVTDYRANDIYELRQRSGNMLEFNENSEIIIFADEITPISFQTGMSSQVIKEKGLSIKNIPSISFHDDFKPEPSRDNLKCTDSKHTTLSKSVLNKKSLNQTNNKGSPVEQSSMSTNYSTFKEGITENIQQGLIRQSTEIKNFDLADAIEEPQRFVNEKESLACTCNFENSNFESSFNTSNLEITEIEGKASFDFNMPRALLADRGKPRATPKASKIPKPVFNTRNLPPVNESARIRNSPRPSKIPQPKPVKTKDDDAIFVTKKKSVPDWNSTI